MPWHGAIGYDVPYMFTMPELTSQAIERADYHAPTRTMQIVFRSGAAYHYAAVPPHVFRELIAHQSPGWYFQNQVRGRYRERKVHWDAAMADCAA